MAVNNKTTNSGMTKISFQPFDTIYTVVFIGLILNLLVGTLINDILHWNSTGTSIFNAVVSLFLFFQLLRMYYHLKHFEEEITLRGNSHFLEIIPKKTQTIEKIIRLFLALILVIFTKIKIEIIDSQSLTLFICFVFLLSWDIFIMKGMKNILNTDPKYQAMIKNPKTENAGLASFRKFYYLERADLTNSIDLKKIYYSKLKFTERILGLIASIIVIIYLIVPKICNDLSKEIELRSILVVLLIISILSIFIIILFVKIKTNDNKKKKIKHTVSGILKDITAPLHKPISTLIRNLKNINSDENIEKIWSRLTFLFLFISLILLSIYHYNNNKPHTTFQTEQSETTKK